MSSDGNLEPGWLNRQIERVHEEARARRIALEWERSIITAEQTSSRAAYEETAEWLRQHGASVVPAYNGLPSASVEVDMTARQSDPLLTAVRQHLAHERDMAERTRRFATWLNILSNSDGRVPGPQGATIEFQTERQDNRCMDTVARSMVEEPKFLGCTNIEDIPLGEYEFMIGGNTIRFTVQCRTIVGDERLVHVVYNQKPSCLGIARFPTRSLCVACMHGNLYAAVNGVKIISQHTSPPTPTSHVRRVEL